MPKRNYLDDTGQAQNSAAICLQFILQNKRALLKRKNGEKHLSNMINISRTPFRKFSPKQMSYIDDVYEMVMKGLGFDSYKGQKSKYGVNLKS